MILEAECACLTSLFFEMTSVAIVLTMVFDFFFKETPPLGAHIVSTCVEFLEDLAGSTSFLWSS